MLQSARQEVETKVDNEREGALLLVLPALRNYCEDLIGFLWASNQNAGGATGIANRRAVNLMDVTDKTAHILSTGK